jgi:hypothetical protein
VSFVALKVDEEVAIANSIGRKGSIRWAGGDQPKNSENGGADLRNGKAVKATEDGGKKKENGRCDRRRLVRLNPRGIL